MKWTLLIGSIAFFWICLYPPPVLGDKEGPKNKITCELFFSESPQADKRDKKKFTQGEKIYVVANLKGLEPGVHDIAFNWYGPSGELEEKWSKAKKTGVSWRCWSWLRVSGGKEGLGLLLPWRRDVIGPWRVVVFLDHIELDSAQFIIE